MTQTVKNLPAMLETWVQSLGQGASRAAPGKSGLHARGEGERVLVPGESQGWGSLVGCRLWGHIESDMTEAT